MDRSGLRGEPCIQPPFCFVVYYSSELLTSGMCHFLEIDDVGVPAGHHDTTSFYRT
jgi:hypothetical protein